MKRCIECSCPIDNDYMEEHCPGCGAPIVADEIVEEFLEEDGMLVNDIDEDDDDFEEDLNFDDEDEDDEDDDFEDDLDEDDEEY